MFYIIPPLTEFRPRNSHPLAHTNTCICSKYSSAIYYTTHLRPQIGKDTWPASYPSVPKLPLPLLGVATTLSLAARSCVAKLDLSYLRYALVPPRRSHQYQHQSLPNPLHEPDLKYTSGAWRGGKPHGHLIILVVVPTDMKPCLPSRVSRRARYTLVLASLICLV